MDTLKVNIDVENGGISVYNSGRGILHIPEHVFGHRVGIGRSSKLAE